MMLVTGCIWLRRPYGSAEELLCSLMVWKQLSLSSHSVLLAHFCLGRANAARAYLALDTAEGAYEQILFISQARMSSLIRQMGKEQ